MPTVASILIALVLGWVFNGYRSSRGCLPALLTTIAIVALGILRIFGLLPGTMLPWTTWMPFAAYTISFLASNLPSEQLPGLWA